MNSVMMNGGNQFTAFLSLVDVRINDDLCDICKGGGLWVATNATIDFRDCTYPVGCPLVNGTTEDPQMECTDNGHLYIGTCDKCHRRH